MQLNRTLLISASVILLIVIGLFVIHEVIETKLFGSLTRTSGMEIAIQSRSGNLLGGYRLRGLEISQQSQIGNRPPFTLTVEELTVHWKLFPFQLKVISWQGPTYTIQDESGGDESFPVGDGMLQPDGTGWLVMDEPVSIGPDSWDGYIEFKLRIDGKEIDGNIDIMKFPSRLFHSSGVTGSRQYLPPNIRIQVDISGDPANPNTETTVTDPITNQRLSL